jgi:hypothetical protein
MISIHLPIPIGSYDDKPWTEHLELRFYSSDTAPVDTYAALRLTWHVGLCKLGL